MSIKKDFDVFISYRHDTGFYMAQLLFSKLISSGYSVFMDKTMSSCRYEEKIRSAIKNSRNYVVVLFPGDFEELKKSDSWLNKEAAWALENSRLNIVPLLCDGFEWPAQDSEMAAAMQAVMQNNGIRIHKDNSLDTDLENLCDNFLKNVAPTKQRINTAEFFRQNLGPLAERQPKQVDVAFHAGSPWLMPGEKRDFIANSMERGIPWRVLINTEEAAESIAQHMRDDDALYVSFSQAHIQWKKLQARYPDLLEVRACPVPLIHVYHSVLFEPDEDGHQYAEQHIKYYAYNNTRPDNAFEHRINSYSPHYAIYRDEFEFLWNKSEKL